MIGLLLIYFIGKYFYDLAILHDKSKWGWAVIGVVSYYAGAFLLAFALGMIAEFISPGFFDNTPEMVLNLVAVPLGLISVYGVYQLVKKNWENNPKDQDMDGFLDAGL